jgi:hypothetical protein
VDLIVHIRRGYDGTRTVRYVSEILEVMPPGDTERPAVNHLFLPDSRTGLAVAAHTASSALLGKLAAVGFDPSMLDQHRSQQYGSQQYGSQQYGSQQYGSQQYGSQQYGSQEYGSRQYASQQCASQQYGSPQEESRQQEPQQEESQQHTPAGTWSP